MQGVYYRILPGSVTLNADSGVKRQPGADETMGKRGGSEKRCGKTETEMKIGKRSRIRDRDDDETVLFDTFSLSAAPEAKNPA